MFTRDLLLLVKRKYPDIGLTLEECTKLQLFLDGSGRIFRDPEGEILFSFSNLGELYSHVSESWIDPADWKLVTGSAEGEQS